MIRLSRGTTRETFGFMYDRCIYEALERRPNTELILCQPFLLKRDVVWDKYGDDIFHNYGELCLLWFDVPMTLEEKHSRKLYEAIKRYRPNCLINSRIGNGAYDYVSLGDNEIPKELPQGVDLSSVDMNHIDGFKPSPDALGRIPTEAADLLRRAAELYGK